MGSVALHACLVLFMFSNWQTVEVREIKPQLQIINATLVEMEAKAPEKPPESQTQVIDLAAQRRAEQQTAAEAQRLAQRKRDEEEKRLLEEQRLKDEAERKQREADEKLAEEERLKQLEEDKLEREQEFEQRKLSEFEEALAQEQVYQAQAEEASVVSSVTSEIANVVGQNWSRPPSARRGMQTVLRVSLVPTGGLSSVEVVESSGDAAFDRSASQAIQKAAPFDVIKQVSPVIFEKNFRTFLFRFNPQDLRL